MKNATLWAIGAEFPSRSFLNEFSIPFVVWGVGVPLSIRQSLTFLTSSGDSMKNTELGPQLNRRPRLYVVIHNLHNLQPKLHSPHSQKRCWHREKDKNAVQRERFVGKKSKANSSRTKCNSNES